jgi:hypothetical protein
MSIILKNLCTYKMFRKKEIVNYPLYVYCKKEKYVLNQCAPQSVVYFPAQQAGQHNSRPEV